MKKLLLLALAIFFGAAAFAQDAPKVQVAVNYSYLYISASQLRPQFLFQRRQRVPFLFLLQTRRPEGRVCGLRQLWSGRYGAREYPGMQQPVQLQSICSRQRVHLHRWRRPALQI